MTLHDCFFVFCVSQYAMFLTLVFLAELVAGVSGFIFRHEVRKWKYFLTWGGLNLQLVRLNQNETVTWHWGNVCHLFSWVKVSWNRLKQVQHHKRWSRAITCAASAAKRWIPLLWYPLSLSQVSASTTQSQPLCYVCDAFILNSSDQSHAGQQL